MSRQEELRQALTAPELAELQRRNEERARQAAQRMGSRYVFHPTNRVQPQRAQGVLR